MKRKIFIYYLIFLILGTAIILLLINKAVIATVVIFYFITFYGYYLSNLASLRLGQNNFKFIPILWLFKLVLTFFLLFWSWIPGLDPNSANFGYDPQRYYFDSFDLIQNGWNPLVSSNYQGIIFYYGIFFYTLGHNPLIPALINSFLTLSIILFFIKFLLGQLTYKTKYDWYIIFLIVIPELIWYDVLTSRESILSFLILALTLITTLFYLKKIKRVNAAIMLFIVLGFILLIRTSLIIPSLIHLSLISFILSKKQNIFNLRMLILFAILIVLGLFVPVLQAKLGGYEVDVLGALESTQSFESNVASSDLNSWSENSIGLLLMPSNNFEAIIFTPLRMILYVLAPIPNISLSLRDMYLGNWVEWQKALTLISSMLMVLGVPYLLSGFHHVVKYRKFEQVGLVLYSTFWIYFIAICGGNLIIHERYRVMISIIFFTCVWYGYTRGKEKAKYTMLWYGLLLLLAFFYFIYKFI